jgi:hypothetical protein
MRIALAAALTLALAGCMGRTDGPAVAEADAISFETGMCYGSCPVYKVTLRKDGSGTFEGKHFTAVTGERIFRVTPEQYRAFADHLEPLRPSSGSVRLAEGACWNAATDHPSAEVTWVSSIGSSQSYHLDYGCDAERNREAIERLRSAPNLLPIREMIGDSRR